MSVELPPEAQHWLGKARSDRLNVENNLSSEHVPWDTVCFHCQQAVEKLLKTLLIAGGARVPRTHDLLDLAQRARPLFSEIDWDCIVPALRILDPFAVAARYGDPPFLEGEEEGREAYSCLLHVWSTVSPALGM